MSGTRKLGRPSDHRMAMLRGMVTYLLENGQIETTVTRAKEVRAAAEKMITIAKEKNDRVLAMRQIMAYVTKEDVAKKLVDEIGPRYADRKGGYTQMFKLGQRRGDGAETVLLCMVDYKKPTEAADDKKKSKKEAKAEPAEQAKAE